ncbi:MAG: hypothetical protein AAB573_01850 [Patescibacteria group bacterium]
MAPLAEYVKALAGRLSEHHTVTVLTYGHLPVEIAGVPIVAIDKRVPLLTRLYRYTRAFMQSAQETDLVLVMNGASTELPFVLASLLMQTKVFFVIGDVAAQQWVEKTLVRKTLQRIAASQAKKIISTVPSPRPEILPLDAYPVAAFQNYENEWAAHRAELGV